MDCTCPTRDGRTNDFWYNVRMRTKIIMYALPRGFACLTLVVIGWHGIVHDAIAAGAHNAYVSVGCEEASEVYAIDNNFYLTIRLSGLSDSTVWVHVWAMDPFHLVAPDQGIAELGPGGSCTYQVQDESGTEDTFAGVISAFKLKVEPDETNVCWKASRCGLKLSGDSVPGGTAFWTSHPAGITGSGRSITFNPQRLEPGSYTVTARSEFFPNYTDKGIVNVVKATELLYLVGQSTSWKRFKRPQKILFGRNSRIKVFTIPRFLTEDGVIVWNGTYGVMGNGFEIDHQYQGIPASSDSDVKTVFTNCGPETPEEFLVCAKVIGIHSSVPSKKEDFLSGHAWLTVTRYESGAPKTTSYGLWGNRPRAKAGADVHIGLEGASGMRNRYFLLSPSQYAKLISFLNADCAWTPFYTCANWAEDGYRVATGETVSSEDIVIFGTPRALGESIADMECSEPTQRDIPFDGGEEAPSSSSSPDDYWSGNSFPQEEGDGDE